jgi:hypothetical protein
VFWGLLDSDPLARGAHQREHAPLPIRKISKFSLFLGPFGILRDPDPRTQLNPDQKPWSTSRYPASI